MPSIIGHLLQLILLFCLIKYSLNALLDSLTIKCDATSSLSSSWCPVNAHCVFSTSLCTCDQFHVSYFNTECVARKSIDESCFMDAQCSDDSAKCVFATDTTDTSSSAKQLWDNYRYKQILRELNQSDLLRNGKVGRCKCATGYVYNSILKRCAKSVTVSGDDWTKPNDVPFSHENFYNLLNSLNNRSEGTGNVITSSSDANGTRNPINKIILIFSLMFVFAIVAEIIVKLLSKTYYNNQRHLITNTYWSYPSSSSSSSSMHNNTTITTNTSGANNNVNSNDSYVNTVPSVSMRFTRAPPPYHQLTPQRTQETVLLLDETDRVSRSAINTAEDKPPSYEEAIRETVAIARQPNESQL